MKELKLDLRQISYLIALVEGEMRKCIHCNPRRCLLTKSQCDSFKGLQQEVFDILNRA